MSVQGWLPATMFRRQHRLTVSLVGTVHILAIELYELRVIVSDKYTRCCTVLNMSSDVSMKKDCK